MVECSRGYNYIRCRYIKTFSAKLKRKSIATVPYLFYNRQLLEGLQILSKFLKIFFGPGTAQELQDYNRGGSYPSFSKKDTEFFQCTFGEALTKGQYPCRGINQDVPIITHPVLISPIS